jgi:hypothetical protein
MNNNDERDFAEEKYNRHFEESEQTNPHISNDGIYEGVGYDGPTLLPNEPTNSEAMPEWELDLLNCVHQDISWHGSRAECQECGQNVTDEYISRFHHATTLVHAYAENYNTRLRTVNKGISAYDAAKAATTLVAGQLVKLIIEAPEEYRILLMDSILRGNIDAYNMIRSRAKS